MRRTSERGDTRVGTLIFFALLIAVGLAAWNVIPVYYVHYDFTDAMEEVCRTPLYKARTPQAIQEMLIKEVRKRELEQWITPDSFQISTTDRNRRIQLTYDREVTVLPGWKKVIKFDYTAEQPLI
jgi:hypothetical protein